MALLGVVRVEGEITKKRKRKRRRWRDGGIKGG